MGFLFISHGWFIKKPRLFVLSSDGKFKYYKVMFDWFKPLELYKAQRYYCFRERDKDYIA